MTTWPYETHSYSTDIHFLFWYLKVCEVGNIELEVPRRLGKQNNKKKKRDQLITSWNVQTKAVIISLINIFIVFAAKQKLKRNIARLQLKAFENNCIK